MNFTTKKLGSVIVCELPDAYAGYKQKFFMTSDVHFDSVFCDRKRLEQDLKETIKDDAGILICGDLLDAMQGRFDPRKSYDEIRPEYATDRYYDAIVEDAYEFFKPYSDRIIYLGYGNHELSTRKNAGTDLLDRLAFLLSQNQVHRIQTGGYDGFVRFMLQRNIENKKKPAPKGSIVYYYNHGAGGNSPVTRGAIQTNRQAVYVDADVVHNGHNHQAYVLPIPQIYLNRENRVVRKLQYHVRTPGYKNHYNSDEWTNWEHQKNLPPSPLGSAWMTIGYEDYQPTVSIQECWY